MIVRILWMPEDDLNAFQRTPNSHPSPLMCYCTSTPPQDLFRFVKVCTLFYTLLIIPFLSMAFLAMLPNCPTLYFHSYSLSGTPSVPYTPIPLSFTFYSPLRSTLISPLSIHSYIFFYMCRALPLCFTALRSLLPSTLPF